MGRQQEEISITYNGEIVKVTEGDNGVDSLFIVHLRGEEIALSVAYIDDLPRWMENEMPTERAEKLGRLIEELDGR